MQLDDNSVAATACGGHRAVLSYVGHAMGCPIGMELIYLAENVMKGMCGMGVTLKQRTCSRDRVSMHVGMQEV